MPRPVKDDPRDCFRSFRFTVAEITRLEARARASGLTLSAYVRGKVFDPSDSDAASGADPSRTPRDGGGQRRPRRDFAARVLAEQLRRVGTNLNQIAHRMNELRLPPPPELMLILDKIRALVREARLP
jgi:hypothetical protein